MDSVPQEPTSQNSELSANEIRMRNLIPFQPGYDERRNAGGRPKKKHLTEALEALLEKNPKESLAIAKAMLKRARKGSVTHFQEIADRTEGKVGNDPASVTNNTFFVMLDAPRPHKADE